MRRALCVPSNPLAVALAHRALLPQPLAVSPFPGNSGKSLWCVSWFAPCCLLFKSLKMAELASHSHMWTSVQQLRFCNLVFIFEVWWLLHIKFLPPKTSFLVLFPSTMHLPCLGEFRDNRILIKSLYIFSSLLQPLPPFCSFKWKACTKPADLSFHLLCLAMCFWWRSLVLIQPFFLALKWLKWVHLSWKQVWEDELLRA